MTKKLAQKKQEQAQARHRTRRWRLLIVFVFFALLAAAELLLSGGWPFRGSSTSQSITNPDAPLADFYRPEVLYWRERILEWGQEYDLNPNVIAIIMQIESCGDPVAISPAGALGLMQVMPFNFNTGENMLNPDTNVLRGMDHLQSCLEFGDWDMGAALACYNGGFVSRANWAPETQAYYYWGTGLWSDVVRGSKSSDTLAEWLNAGGQRLCDRADLRLYPVAVASPVNNQETAILAP